jgi:hypothetical protein
MLQTVFFIVLFQFLFVYFCTVWITANDLRRPKKALAIHSIQISGLSRRAKFPRSCEEYQQVVYPTHSELQKLCSKVLLQLKFQHTMCDSSASKSQVKPPVRSLLESERCDSDKDLFWVVARAIRDFYREHQALPLTGTIPDMTSDTKSYIALQKL